VREKGPLLAARERLDTLRTDLALSFAETVKLLEGALLREEANATARAELASLWRGRLAEAEIEGDAADSAYALQMMRRYDDGALAAVIEGDGSLALDSIPQGAEVRLSRLVPSEGILVPDETRRLGRTPVGPVELSMGSYLAVLAAPGCREVRYPVHISRNREWIGRVRLRTDEEIGESFVFVPGGPFVFGEGKDARILELPDFAIGRHSVTFEEYGRFLDELPEEQVLAHMPRTQTEGALMTRGADGRHRPKADLIDQEPHLSRYRRDYGEDFLLRMPVLAISFDDAVAYCRWKSRTTGLEWRLPIEEEMEKAARGVDGRRFPWGDLEDATLGKCRVSRNEPPQPEPVGSFPTATSIYGMEDAAGNVWDWTDTWSDDQRSLRVLRGGAWLNEPAILRCTMRSRNEPSDRYTAIGFRPARSLR
jgi:serine/threonine-protein kinase